MRFTFIVIFLFALATFGATSFDDKTVLALGDSSPNCDYVGTQEREAEGEDDDEGEAKEECEEELVGIIDKAGRNCDVYCSQLHDCASEFSAAPLPVTCVERAVYDSDFDFWGSLCNLMVCLKNPGSHPPPMVYDVEVDHYEAKGKVKTTCKCLDDEDIH